VFISTKLQDSIYKLVESHFILIYLQEYIKLLVSSWFSSNDFIRSS